MFLLNLIAFDFEEFLRIVVLKLDIEASSISYSYLHKTQNFTFDLFAFLRNMFMLKQ